MGSQQHIVILLVMFRALQRTRAQPPFPPLSNFSAAAVGEPVFVFEGVDYDALPAPLRPEYHDCYTENHRCIRFRHSLEPVCGYNVWTGNWDGYVNMCQLNLQNCLEMTKLGRGMHGKRLRDRIIFFMGEGKKCEHAVRRSHRRVRQ